MAHARPVEAEQGSACHHVHTPSATARHLKKVANLSSIVRDLVVRSRELPHVDRAGHFLDENVRQPEALPANEGSLPVQCQAKMHDRGTPILMLRFGPEASLLVARVYQDKLPHKLQTIAGTEEPRTDPRFECALQGSTAARPLWPKPATPQRLLRSPPGGPGATPAAAAGAKAALKTSHSWPQSRNPRGFPP